MQSDAATRETGLKAAMPGDIVLQLATPVGSPPEGDGWLHEIKFDGYRIAVRVESGRVRLLSRNGLDWTSRFREVADALQRLNIVSAVIDGEVIARDPAGNSDFGKLQAALQQGGRGLTYQAFDLLYLDGHDLRGLGLEQRKELLRQLLAGSPGTVIRYTDHLDTGGARLLTHACRLGIEGIVSKLSGSPYRPGRQPHWVKSVCLRTGDFVVGGYTVPQGKRDHFGALLLGETVPGSDAPEYVGKVGTGFSQEQLAELYAMLEPLTQPSSPFSGAVPREIVRGGVRWVRPELVAEVAYQERTRDGRLRLARFKHLREDKGPPETTRKGNMPMSDRQTVLEGITLTNPDRVLYPGQGVTKADLARYYIDIGEEQLRWLRNRPLSLVRCPDGAHSTCFYQKHPGAAFADRVPRMLIEEDTGRNEYLVVQEAADVVALVQAGVLEIHAWGSQADALETPDLLVFDLDPDPGITFQDLKGQARALRKYLEDLGLVPFLRVTGGKGLHLVVPIEPELEWDDVKEFCKGIAQEFAAVDPDTRTANMSKAKRKGRVFIDYLRNGRGATAITNWSTRSRAGAPVAVPVSWQELGRLDSASTYDITSARRRLRSLRSDPWGGYEAGRRSLRELAER